MKPLSILAYTCFFLVGNFSFAQGIDCHYDDRPSDGDMGKVIIESVKESYYKLKFQHISSGFGPGPVKEIDLEIPLLSCRFSDHYLYVFSCQSVTEEGFRGKYQVYGSIVLGMYGKDNFKLEIENEETEEKTETYFPIEPHLTEYEGVIGITYKGCAGSSRLQ